MSDDQRDWREEESVDEAYKEEMLAELDCICPVDGDGNKHTVATCESCNHPWRGELEVKRLDRATYR